MTEGGNRLPPRSRITKTADIRRLLAGGRGKKTGHLDVFFSDSPQSRPRMGIIVPKHRRRIVERNRLKRRLREIGRIEVLPRLREGSLDVDVLVRARREAYEPSFEELSREMIEVTESIRSES